MIKFSLKSKIEKKDYLSCGNYYLKRFIGLREIILVTLLLGAGIGLFFVNHNLLVLILGSVAVALMLVAIIVYICISVKSFDEEFKKRGATEWKLTFDDEGMNIETTEKNGDMRYRERRLYSKIDKIAIKKDVVYIYASGAMMYYVKYDSEFEEGNFVEFCDFIKSVATPLQLKMRANGKKGRMFPYNAGR